MPTYLYECKECGVFEEVHSVAAPPITHCPKGHHAKKIIAPIAGVAVAPETTSARYQKWFHSEATQAKLKSGEYEIARKSSDINHL